MYTKLLIVEPLYINYSMSIYYDLYASGNPLKREEQQPLHARVIPSGTLDAKKFIELVSKSNGFSQATIEGFLHDMVIQYVPTATAPTLHRISY